MKRGENMRMQENEAGRVDVLIRPRTETEVWLSEEMIYPHLSPSDSLSLHI